MSARRLTLLCLAMMPAVALAGGEPVAAPKAVSALRCGWFDNPTPGNASLFDKDGEWTVAIQGGHQAKGSWPPKFAAGQWVRTGTGSSGYGCACLRVRTDAGAMNVLEIVSAVARPLSVCRTDRSLKEPINPLGK